jgi:hypothetical protein
LAPETEPSSFAQSSRGLRALPYIAMSRLAFLLGVVLSRSDAPNENASETVHPQDTSTPEGQSDQSGPRGPLVIHPPVDTSKSNNSGNHTTPFWEKAAVLVALGLLVVNTMQMCASKKSADAANSAAVTTNRQLTAFENVQRARLVAQFVDATVYKQNESLYIRGTIKVINVGQSAALQFNITHGTAGSQRPPQDCSLPADIIKPNPYGPAISAAGTSGATFEYPYNIQLGEPTEINNHRYFAMLDLYITYFDIFGGKT